MTETVLHTHALQVQVDRARVLHNVSVDILAGTCTALLGPNGSGKTTFLRAVLGLIPSDGDVVWFSRREQDYRATQRVALVPQMLPGVNAVPVSVAEFVESAFSSPSSRFTRWRNREQRAAARDAALTRVDLVAKAHRTVDALSGGEQRRALFARATVTGADVILMDEPLAGVDVEHQEHLVGILRTMLDAGATLVVVAHELDVLASIVDHVVVFGGVGQSSIVYQGGPSPQVLSRHLKHEPHHLHELQRHEQPTSILEM
ncbi:MAG: ATP-binding cassette domain-containing protein [Actinomycetales bacterium]|nr:ATP-binding cassette domain-containing protein [Actinomycetales bacterium]